MWSVTQELTSVPLLCPLGDGRVTYFMLCAVPHSCVWFLWTVPHILRLLCSTIISLPLPSTHSSQTPFLYLQICTGHFYWDVIFDYPANNYPIYLNLKSSQVETYDCISWPLLLFLILWNLIFVFVIFLKHHHSFLKISNDYLLPNSIVLSSYSLWYICQSQLTCWLAVIAWQTNPKLSDVKQWSDIIVHTFCRLEGFIWWRMDLAGGSFLGLCLLGWLCCALRSAMTTLHICVILSLWSVRKLGHVFLMVTAETQEAAWKLVKLLKT